MIGHSDFLLRHSGRVRTISASLSVGHEEAISEPAERAYRTWAYRSKIRSLKVAHVDQATTLDAASRIVSKFIHTVSSVGLRCVDEDFTEATADMDP